MKDCWIAISGVALSSQNFLSSHSCQPSDPGLVYNLEYIHKNLYVCLSNQPGEYSGTREIQMSQDRSILPELAVLSIVPGSLRHRAGKNQSPQHGQSLKCDNTSEALYNNHR